MRLLRSAVLCWLAGLALLSLGGCGAVRSLERSMLYHPQPARHAASSLMLPVDGATLQVSVVERADAPAILYFGGNAEDVSAVLPQLARLFPEHALYLMHYRGYGQSTGEPSEEALHADANRLFAHVRRGHTVVKVVGRSLGSGVAVRLASEQPVERLVLVTPYDSIENVAADEFPLLPVRWLMTDRFDSAAVAASIKTPTTLIGAEQDTLIRPERTRRLAAAFSPGVARDVWIAGANHNNISGKSEYERALADALR